MAGTSRASGRIIELRSTNTRAERRRVLGELCGHLDANFSFLCGISASGERDCYTGVEAAGDPDASQRWQRLDGEPTVPHHWRVRRRPTRHRNVFTPLARDLSAETMEALGDAKYHAHYTDLLVCDQLRAFLYDGNRFVGYVALLRRGRVRFTSADLQTANANVGRLVRRLVSIDACTADVPGPAHLMTDPTGRVRFACPTASRWLDESKMRRIGDVIRAVERGDDAIFVIDGVRADVARMTGEGAVQYLLTLQGVPAVHLHATAVLSTRQADIADFAASGATAREIARHFDIRPDTVRKHLKAVYQRLGVATRLELKAVLDHTE